MSSSRGQSSADGAGREGSKPDNKLLIGLPEPLPSGLLSPIQQDYKSLPPTSPEQIDSQRCRGSARQERMQGGEKNQ